jgi:mRNA interferase MazF
LTIEYHPKRGTIVCVNFGQGFRVPEMVKPRLCVVISPPIKARHGLCTVVPLSQTAPNQMQDYHYEIQIPFQMPPRWGNDSRWVKGDMVCAVGWHRVDLLRLGKDRNGKRTYQLNTLSSIHLQEISNCVLHGLGLPPLT